MIQVSAHRHDASNPFAGVHGARMQEGVMSNQTVLGNGCVCPDGCEACGRLVKLYQAASAVLGHVIGMKEILGDCCNKDIERLRKALKVAK